MIAGGFALFYFTRKGVEINQPKEKKCCLGRKKPARADERTGFLDYL